MIGVLTATFVSCIFFYAVYANATTDPKEFFYWLGGGVVAGIVLGCILCKKQKAGVALLAGWGGITLGLMVDEMFVYRFGYSWSSYACMMAGASLTGWAVTKWYDQMIIACTALIGAYLITQGAAFYLGSTFNVFTAAKLVQAGLYDQIDQMYLFYCGGFLILALMGYLI